MIPLSSQAKARQGVEPTSYERAADFGTSDGDECDQRYRCAFSIIGAMDFLFTYAFPSAYWELAGALFIKMFLFIMPCLIDKICQMFHCDVSLRWITVSVENKQDGFNYRVCIWMSFIKWIQNIHRVCHPRQDRTWFAVSNKNMSNITSWDIFWSTWKCSHSDP